MILFLRFPFDWKTPFGYLVAFALQSSGCICISWVYAQFTSFLFGSCWFFIFVAKDITTDFDTFNADVKSQDGNRQKLRENFCNLIEIFSDAKQ